LLLEVSDGEAESILRELAGAGFDVVCRRAHTPEGFRQGLEPPPAAIVADATQCREDLWAWKHVQGLGLDIPFILLISAAEGELAAHALRQGLTDYVFKDRLARLGPALTLALARREPLAIEDQRQQIAGPSPAALDAREARAAAALRWRDRAIAAIDQGFVIIDARVPDCPILYANPAFQDLTGYRVPEVLGKNCRFLQGPGTNPEAIDAVGKAMRQGTSCCIELLTYRKDGTAFWNALSLSAVRNDAGLVEYFVGLLEDVTTRKQAADEQKRRADILEATPDLVATASLDGRILYLNRAGRHLLGLSEADALDSVRLENCYPDWAWRLFQEQGLSKVLQAGFWSAETALLDRSGREVPIWQALVAHRSTTGEVSHLSTVARDLTPYKRLEQQFRQAQKMEAVGRLAAGVAHDFNNLLTIISGYSALLLHRPRRGEGGRKYLEQIRQAGDRAAALTRQLLAFSRKQVLHPEVIDLNTLLRHMENMLRRLIGEDVDMTAKLAADLGPVRADPGQIEQVVMNLAVNARDAMPTGGRLTIATSNVELDDSDAVVRPEIRPGPYVLLAVSDTGCGMTAEVKNHLFEPFFTTKEVGQGTGLGLATVYGIVKQSNGYVYVDSEPHQGATFRIYLPRLPAGETAAATVPAPAPFYPGGKETILVVEDMAEVRGLARDTLAMRGYRVLEAADGSAALALAERHDGPIDLLLTDVIMPAMSGRELAERLAADNRCRNVLYMSGYPDDAVLRHGLLTSKIHFLQKPFAPLHLLRKVREVLDAAAASRVSAPPAVDESS
jgi:PAS domain S-box-containing protein